MNTLRNRVEQILSSQTGRWGVAIHDRTTNERLFINEQLLFSAASIIKIPIMMEAYRQADFKKISLEKEMVLKEEDIVGGCGVLQGMHRGLELSIRDIIVLMITVSDNTATNMMIDLLGIESINQMMRNLGVENSILRRKLMMPELARQGIRNELSAKDVVLLLDQLADGTFVSKEVCDDMLSILKLQQLNHKIPLLLPEDVSIAHKTGEDTGITHNAGIIVYHEKSLSMCVLSEDVSDIPEGHLAISRIARAAFDERLT